MTGPDLSIGFAPLLSPALLLVIGILGAAPLVLAVWRRAPGTAWRAFGGALLLLWLAGPHRILRTGTPLPDIGLLVVDRSGSMQVGRRTDLASAAAASLLHQAAGRPDLQLRRIDVPEAGTDGTRLFAGIAAGLAEIPPDQRAGVIAITDGAVEDAPAGFALPLHVLIPAAGEQADRRLRIITAPGYGIVGQSVDITLEIDDLGTAGTAPAHLSWSLDGAPQADADIATGQKFTLTIPISHAGPSTLALQASALPGEASLLNNRAALTINGVRDRLRVLLISGEPHEGERTWRRLLKADPAVDLVHFTILRPPGKDDLTPLNQLALIAFPTHELFVEKIRQFDLVILDRFSDPGILPRAYLQNIADYVRAGGALLVSAGPEFATDDSIAYGPIGEILPAMPDQGADAIVTGAFRPTVTPLGERHPVTQNLDGDAPGGTPGWGSWYRRIAATPQPGSHAQIVLTAGPDAAAPLLLLDHVDQGRVALLLSDQIWLWSRGHEGGGPQAELLRRVAHWLMREPELDETALTAAVADGRLAVTHRDIVDVDPHARVTVTAPDGTTTTLALQQTATGASLSTPAIQPGLWQARLGDQHAYAASTPSDPAELADLRATATRLRPIARSIHWLATGMPALSGLALARHHALRLTGIETPPLLPAWLALPLLLLAFGMAWWREGQ